MSSAKQAEEQLIKENKDGLDKNEKQLIKAYKRGGVGDMKPIVKYFWKKCVDGNWGMTINIQCPDDETWEKVKAAENALSKIGITFDTGYGGSRDWEFDWSLNGYHFVFNYETEEYEYVERCHNIDKDKPPVDLVHEF